MKRSAFFLVLLIDACRTPTALTVRVVTDVPCSAQRGVTIAAASWEEYETAPPTARATRCAPLGNGLFDTGTIVVTPRNDGADRIGIKVVVGVARDAETCTGTGCIVSKRKLSYIPHTELPLTITALQECADIACGPDTTCVGRVCKSPEIDPQGCKNGCGDELIKDRCNTPGKVECTGGKRATCLPDRTLKIEDCGLLCSATACVGATQVLAIGANDEMGSGTSCALVGSDVYCWGSNIYQRAGLIGADVQTPTKVAGLPAIAEIAAGGTAQHVYARDTAGGVWCWGVAAQGQCGAPEDTFTTPRKMVASGIARVATGSVFGCMITTTGDVTCVGSNGRGQLGRGTMGDKSATPQPIGRTGWSGRAVDLSCMTNTCCLLDDKGAVACWGNNGNGQVGDGSAAPEATSPAKVALDRKVRAIRAGDQNICALAEDSSVWCWGAPNRNIFIDVANDQRSPHRIAALDDKEVVALATGMPQGHYAITRNRTVLGWGTDGLHVGGIDGVPALTGATSIGIATGHGCAVIAGGIQCWGSNSAGQLGDGSAGHPGLAPVTWK